MSRLAALVLLALVGLHLAACRGAPFGEPLPDVPGLVIEGNTVLDHEALVEAAARHLASFLENERRPADADDAAYAMAVAIRSQGYPEAEVRFEQGADTLRFVVAEGRRAEVAGVRFEGVESIPESDLRPFFEFEGSGFLWLGPPLVVPPRVAAAASNVAALYRQRGFVRVEVADPELAWRADDRAEIVIRVEEGPRYTLGSLTFRGVEPAPEERREAGTLYSPRLPLEVASAVRTRLRNAGHGLAEVEASATLDDEQATADVVIEARPGPLTRLRDVRFEGGSSTRRSFLRRRFDIARGELVRREAIEEGVAELYRSRLFESVVPRLHPGGGGEVDLEVTLRETESRRLDLEGGWGSWDLLYGRATYLDHNLFGIARTLRLEGEASLRGYRGAVQVVDPWVLGINDRVWARVEFTQREEPFYDYTGLEVRLAVDHRFDRRHRLEGGYHFRLEEASNVEADLPPDIAEEVDGFLRAAGPYAIYVYDDRDDAFLPTRGLYAQADARLSLPELGASLAFVELGARATWHVDLGGAGVLAIGGEARTIDPFRGTVLPLSERLFLGGAASVRSFGLDELTPVDDDGDGVGARTTATGHLEWRFPILGELHGALFTDAGFVAPDPFSLDGDLGWGVGAGLRFHTPVGPARLDAAYNPGDLFAADERFQIHLSFGFSF